MAAATLVLGVPQSPATGLADAVRLVNLPTGSKWIRIKPRVSDCKIVVNYAGADDVAIGGAVYEEAPAGFPWERDISAGNNKIGVASGSATVTFEIVVMG
jgi:hypothetical protein